MKREDASRKFKCCICHEASEGWGNNPQPWKEKGRCCDDCNRDVVLPARIMLMIGRNR